MKTVAKMAFPMFLASAVNFVLSFFDTAIIGHVGLQSLSATVAGSSLYSIYIQVIGVLVIGFQVFGAQEIVKEGGNKFRDYFRATFFTMYGFVLLFVFISLLFSRQLLWLFSTPAIIGQASLYFFSRLPSLLFTPFSLCLKTQYDIQKQTKVGMVYTLIVVGTDLFLDIVFIYGFGWGVFGAGLSDTIGVFVGMLYLLAKNHQDGIVRVKEILNFERIERGVFVELNKLNIPEVINMLLDYLGSSALFIIISRISLEDIAEGRIFSLYIKIIFMLSLNVGTVVQILLLRNQGKGAVLAGLKFAIAIVCPLTLIAIVSPQIFSIPFTSNASLISAVRFPMIILWVGLLSVPVITITTGILRARKRNKQNMYVNILSTWILQVPAAFVFCLVLDLGIWGFVFSYLAYFAGRIFGNLFFLRERGNSLGVLES